MISEENIIENTKHHMTTSKKMINLVAIKYLTHLVMISVNSFFRRGER